VFSTILIANKIFCATVCGTRNSSQQTLLQCLSTIDMAFSDEDKILIKTQNTPRIHSYARRGIKIGALKCNLFAFLHIC